MNNEIKLSVTQLKSVLPGFNKVIPRRATLPVLGCLRLDRDNMGLISLTATDLDDHLTARWEGGTADDPRSLLVPYEPLARAVKHAGQDESIIIVDGGDAGLKLRTFLGDSPIDQALDRIEVSEFPALPVVNGLSQALDVPMRQALRQAFECASQDESRLILNSSYLDVSNPDAHYIVATNGRQLFSANSFRFGLKESLLLPSRKFLGWSGFWEGETCALSSEPGKDQHPGWVRFETEQWTFTTRQIEGNYPNWKQIVPSGDAKTVITLGETSMKRLLELIPKLPGKDQSNSPIALGVAHGQLTLRARTKETEHCLPIPDVTITGLDMVVGLNREYLLRALQFGLNEIHLVDPLTPIVCQNQGKRLIIAPVTLDGTKPSPATTEKQTTETMSKTTEITEAPETALKKVIDQIERIKETLKSVLTDFGDVLTALKTAEKEKKASEKEIESIRATLRSLQKVQI